VTQAEYTEALGDSSSNFSGGRLPVEQVSWLDAVHYCNARSELEGLTLAYGEYGTGDQRDGIPGVLLYKQTA